MLNKKLTVLFCAGTLFLTNVRAAAPTAVAPDKAAYELQMQCGRDAREWFAYARQRGQLSTKEGIASSKFRNHYNVAFNKCFVLATSVVRNPVYPNALNERFQVFDISENVEVAGLQTMTDTLGPTPVYDQVISCSIKGTYCGDGVSAQQWHETIRLYMEG
jgi:hypothetical protein